MTHAHQRQRSHPVASWMYSGAIAGLALSLNGFLSLPAIAQVTLDGSLGAGGALAGPDYVVPQAAGRAAGINLFHSFGQFNILTGESVTFESDPTIRNILARVIGGPSRIEGLLATRSQTANLFLINSSGIVFGQGARLNVGGSFVATTADGIGFGNQGQFSALPAIGEDVSLLTIDPSALRFNQAMGQAIAPINLTLQRVSPFEVPNGQSLLLVGGNVSLFGNSTGDRHLLRARGGRVEFAALSGTGTVSLLRDAAGRDLRLGVPSAIGRADISINGRAEINVRSGGGGFITLYGRDVTISGRSRLISGIGDNLGSAGSAAGDIQIDATGAVRMDDRSQINNNITDSGAGIGGDVLITARSLLLSGQDTLISANTNSQRTEACNVQACNAGNIIIRADNLTFTNPERYNGDDGAGLQSNTRGIGNAGNIDIEINGDILLNHRSRIENRVRGTSRENPNVRGTGGTTTLESTNPQGSITIARESRINSTTDANGRGGSVILIAPRLVNITGRRSGTRTRSTISVAAEGSARQPGGNIEITTNLLQVQDGGFLNASTSGRADAGNVTLNVGRLEVTTGGELEVSTTSGGSTPGSAGSISINAPGGSVLVSGRRYGDNSEIAVDTEGRSRGQGGIISITADTIQVQGRGEITAINGGQAGSGSITLNFRRLLELTQGGRINARTDSQGNAGDLTINANGGDILLSGSSPDNGRNAGLFATTRNRGNAGNILINDANQILIERRAVIAAGTELDDEQPLAELTGQGGNLTINAERIQIATGGGILVNSDGLGAAGNMVINAPVVLLVDNGRISAETQVSSGGNITLDELRLLSVNNSSISASTVDGRGGSLTINAANGRVEASRNGSLTVAASGIGSPGNLNLTAQFLTLQEGARIAATNVSSNVADTGNIRLSGLEGLVVGSSQISASTQTGRAGSVAIAADTIRLQGTGGLAVEATNGGSAGNLSITSTRLVAQDGARVTVSSTNQGSAGSLRVTARDVVLDNGAGFTAETTGGTGGDIRLRILNSLRLTSGSDISASTVSGSGGNLIINAGGSPNQHQQAELRPTNLISLNRGSRLSARATGTGNAGSVAIAVRQLLLNDQPGVPEPSGIFASSVSGIGGDVTLQQVEALTLNNSRISASTQTGRGGSLAIQGMGSDMTLSGTGGLFVEAIGTGSAGNIEVITRQLTLQNGARISAANRSFLPDANTASNFGNIRLQGLETLTVNNSQITASTQTGRGGSLIVNAANAVQLSGNGGLTVEATRNGGIAGDLRIRTGQLRVEDGARVTVSSPQGQAGNLTVAADQIRLDRGELDAETGSRGANQANIQLRGLNVLVLRNGSQISARAFRDGNGGNVEIDAGNGYVVAVPNENSDIIANAEGGSGGNINITTQSIVGLIETDSLDPRNNPISEINASSEFGLSGNIVINTPGIEPGQGLLELPENVVDASRLVAQGCAAGNTAAQAQSEFVVTGRGGLPPNPEQPLQQATVIADWVSLDPSHANPSQAIAPNAHPDQGIVEAQGWAVDDAGQVFLIADASLTPAYCSLR
ncbi:filamentous hemagglutinin N-terminal domain-containing protein [Oscillatoria sp. FACHB-1407]|uniref:two-partner secretion domain-containing protein n=1 Tax=Oscillatoria sp. FACHB-1407 TaxID=2692847 RepID=UPI001688EFD0|nr:filamentous hemagglutinin N-terminal domain-containing protein [Oscillatoria sp. FACHB-1407]MBD2463286.1 filamentous hemagglutinin N-terminal domain-containing protein [Oscillatoria sp. FACHB-1407]